MSVLLDQHSSNQLVRQFERGILQSTLEAAALQLQNRSDALSPSLKKWQEAAPNAVDHGESDSPDAAELMTTLTLYGVELPSPIRRFSAGYIEAMQYVRNRISPSHAAVPLDLESLSYVASFFSSPGRMGELLQGDEPEDADLRRLLKEWGPPFLICMRTLASHWPDWKLLDEAGNPRAEPSGEALQSEPEAWTEEKNTRRCELIDKKIQHELSTEESAELDRLQLALRRHLDRLAPLPMEGAKRLHAELLRQRGED